MRSKAGTALSVSELSAELGVDPRTVRYYDQIGLLTASARTMAGYRRYGPAERDRLRFILKAKVVGLALNEIRDILTIRDNGMTPCAHVVGLLEAKLRQLDRHIQALSDFREELVAVQREATHEPPDSGCVCGLLEHHESRHDAVTLRLAAQIVNRRPEHPG
jgi:DNA-binding transcriptional MerR regulator